MAFGLKLRKFPKEEVRERVRGGGARCWAWRPCSTASPRRSPVAQRQRVALGRAIVRKPSVFLFDEPLSNLDAKLRVQTRTEISKLHTTLGATMIYVTHDQVEAMTMGDRIVVLRRRPHPAGGAAAGALRPPGQHVRGQLYREPGHEPDPRGHPGRRVRLRGGRRDGRGRWSVRHAGPVTLGVRPEDLYTDVRRAPGPAAEHAGVAGVLEVEEPMGNEIFAYVRTSPASLLVARDRAPAAGGARRAPRTSDSTSTSSTCSTASRAAGSNTPRPTVKLSRRPHGLRPSPTHLHP